MNLFRYSYDAQIDLLYMMRNVGARLHATEHFLDHAYLWVKQNAQEDNILCALSKHEILGYRMGLTVVGNDILVGGNYITTPANIMNPTGLSEFLFHYEAQLGENHPGSPKLMWLIRIHAAIWRMRGYERMDISRDEWMEFTNKHWDELYTQSLAYLNAASKITLTHQSVIE